MSEVTKAKERSSKAIQCMFAGVAGTSLITGGFVEFLSDSINGKWGIFLGILSVILITLEELFYAGYSFEKNNIDNYLYSRIPTLL